MKIRNPRVEFPTPQAIPLAPMTDKSPLRIGIINNQKPNATELIDSFLKVLKGKREVSEVVIRTKSPPSPAAPNDLAELAKCSDLVLVGTAD